MRLWPAAAVLLVLGAEPEKRSPEKDRGPVAGEKAFLAPRFPLDKDHLIPAETPSVNYVFAKLVAYTAFQEAPEAKIEEVIRRLDKAKAFRLVPLNTPIAVLEVRKDLPKHEPDGSISAEDYPVRISIEAGTFKGYVGWVSVYWVSPYSRKKAPRIFGGDDRGADLQLTLDRRRAQKARQRMRADGERNELDRQLTQLHIMRQRQAQAAAAQNQMRQSNFLRARASGLCGAPTLDGTPCRRPTLYGGFCYQHR